MKFTTGKLDKTILLDLYENLLLPRLIEEKMILLLRQGKISKWFSGIGQEATSVGAAMAMGSEEFILPMHRNLGVFTSRKVPLDKLFAQFQGKPHGFTKGRDRSFHFGTKDYGIVGMISHLGAQLAVADGIALADLVSNQQKVTLVFSGDGGTSEGDFHESLNVASVWNLPVIFIIENNGYGLSTPSLEQFNFKSFTDKGIGYGIEAISIDGNNVLEVYRTVKQVAAKIRKSPRPVLIESNTFRMRGHEEASGTKYVPKKLMDEWSKKDPIMMYQNFLIKEKLVDQKYLDETHESLKRLIDHKLEDSYSMPSPVADSSDEILDLFALNTSKIYPSASSMEIDKSVETEELRFVDAIRSGIDKAMESNEKLILMGQDIAEYGGVFKVTEGLHQKYGGARIRNTPLCESAILGISLGLSIQGYKSIVEMQFADFVSCGFNQIVNNLAKSHYRWGQQADVVIRMPTGAGVSAGPFHSQSNEAWFFHTPGLKIVYPSTPGDAYGLFLSAVEDPNPILFFEHKALYRSLTGPVPTDYHLLPIGKAAIRVPGDSATIITYGMGVIWAQQLLEQHPHLSVELVDLCSLQPWDQQVVAESVKKTGKVLVLHEDSLTGGIGGEIASWIGENCFEHLDAPVMRVGSLDTPVPFASSLEHNYLPVDRFKAKLFQLLDY